MSDETEEIWALYADDGAQSLDAMEQALSALLLRPDDTSAIASLFRAMHTFKGNSRILGLGTIEALSHVAEDVIGLVRDDGVPFDKEHYALLLDCVDQLRGMMEATLATRTDVSTHTGSGLAQRLRDKLQQCKDAPKADMETSAAEDANDGDAEEFAEAVLFDNGPAALAEDPVYRQMFFEMVCASMHRLGDLVTQHPGETEAQMRELADIHDAAVRIGMADWPSVTQNLMRELESTRDGSSAHASLGAYIEAQKTVGSAQTDTGALVWKVKGGDLDSAVSVPAAVRMLLPQHSPESADMRAHGEALEIIKTWAREHELLGIYDLCLQAEQEATLSDARELALFNVADMLARSATNIADETTQILAQWLHAGAYGAIQRVTELLGQDHKEWQSIAGYLLQFAAACRCRNWETAQGVTQSLADICYRVGDGEVVSGPVLNRLLASFIETARTMLEADVTSPGSHLAALESLLVGTAQTASMISAPAAGRLLNDVVLPEAFARTLSVESVERARQVIDAQGSLSIVRADFSRNTACAEQFASWIARDKIECIGSVTVFEGDTTKFDFLLGAAYPSERLALAVEGLDPEGLTLSFAGEIPRARPDAVTADEAASISRLLVTEIHEALGELSVARAAIRQTLTNYIEADLPGIIEGLVARHAGDMGALRTSISHVMLHWQEKIEHLMRAEILGTGDMGRLEEIVTEISGGIAKNSSIVDGMVVQVAGLKYIIPIQDIEQIVHMSGARILNSSAEAGRKILKLASGALLPVFNLHVAESGLGCRVPGGDQATPEEAFHGEADEYFDEVDRVARGDAEQGDDTQLFVVAKSEKGRMAFRVDELLGQQSVFVKPLQGYLSGVRSVSGCALLNSGDVGMVLDVSARSEPLH